MLEEEFRNLTSKKFHVGNNTAHIKDLCIYLTEVRLQNGKETYDTRGSSHECDYAASTAIIIFI